MGVTKVSDSLSNAEEQIVQAAQVIGKSKDRAQVFAAVCYGKQKIKSVGEISKRTGLMRKRVLEEGKRLASNHLIHQTLKDGETAYEKDDFLSAHKRRILSCAGNKKKIASVPTKRNPHISNAQITSAKLPRGIIQVRQITIDDIRQFSKASALRASRSPVVPVGETEFKSGIKAQIGEEGKFSDWGGEGNDLFTTRAVVCGKRRALVFAFKGKGTKGKLTPKSMGKNGDQIQRLFRSPAEVFIVQYWGQVDESIIEQMEAFATAKSIKEDKQIFFGVIDGQDSAKLIRAYSHHSA